MALPITGGNGSPTSQASTQTPQASVGPSGAATTSGGVQPGTASSLLTTSSATGISLKSQVLPTVTVSGTSTGSLQAADTKTTPAKHHANVVLVGIAVVLLVAAVAFFWTTARSAKNTTE
jgi:hypothetical protein